MRKAINPSTRIWIRLLTVILLCQSGLAREISLSFTHLTVEDGLSQNWAKAICQDKYGFMWFGTHDGLNKFDGYTFTVYRHEPDNPFSLRDNSISSIFKDSKGKLWVGTENGLNLYDPEKDHFIHHPNWPVVNILDMLELDDGRLLMGSSGGGLYLLDVGTNQVKEIKYDPSVGQKMGYNVVNALLADDQGRVWVGSHAGLCWLDDGLNTYCVPKTLTNRKNSVFNTAVRSIFQDSQHRIWIGSIDGALYHLEYDAGVAFTPENLRFVCHNHDSREANSSSQGAVRVLLQDKRGFLWIGHENIGLDILDLNAYSKGRTVFQHFHSQPYVEKSLSNNSIWSIYEDHTGIIWIGTYGAGVNAYHPLIHKFTHYAQQPQGLNHPYVNSILEEGDSLWICTEKGVNLLIQSKKRYQYFEHDSDNPVSLGANAALSLLRDSGGNLWVGTWRGGLNLLDEKTGEFKRFLNHGQNDGSIGSNNIYDLFEDSNKRLWVSTMGGGLNRFDSLSGTFKKYVTVSGDSASLLNNWVVCVFEDSYGMLWVASTSNVSVFNQKEETFTHFFHDPADSTTISYDDAYMFFEDSQRNLWIGTEDGLNLFHRETATFSHYFVEDGLPNNHIKGILEDDHGNLWLSTNRGLSKFVNAALIPEEPQFVNYDLNNGLQSIEFNQRACEKGRDGSLFFGGSNGLSRFHPDSLKQNSFIPPVMITRFLLFNTPVFAGDADSPLESHISQTRQLKLTHDQSVMTFEFAALNYIYPESNQYAYRLAGFEDEWNWVKNQRSATYTNLNPGKYVFHVKASNNDGIWNEHGTSIEIVISPPFWGRGWFRFVIGLFITGGVFLAFYWRFHLMQKRAQRLEHLVHEKTLHLIKTSEALKKSNQELEYFATAASHDLQEPLRKIQAFGDRLHKHYSQTLDERGTDYLNRMQNASVRMQVLINNLLTYSRVTTKARPFETVDLNQVLKDVIGDLEKRIELVNGKVLISALPELEAEYIQMHQLFQNLIGNALKFHQPDAAPVVRIFEDLSSDVWHGLSLPRTSAKCCRIMLEDNGIGIDKKHQERIFQMFQRLHGRDKYEGTGIGLAICQKIISRHDGRLVVRSIEGVGTLFIIILPLEQNKDLT